MTSGRSGQILSAMRLVGIEPIVVDVPLREPVHGVHGVATVQRSVLVRAVSDDGGEGWGNVDPTPGYSAMSPGEVHDTVQRIGPALSDADKQGGLLRTLAMVECAAAAGLRVVIGHGFGLTFSTLAEVAVAAVSAAIVDGCEAVGPLKMAGDVVVEPARLDAGSLRLDSRPGPGATLDPDALKRYRVGPETKEDSR